MKPSLVIALALAVATTTAASARHAPYRTKSESSQGMGSQEMGTPEQRAACRPDVHRFCRSIKPEEGPFGYVNCLQEHREKLRAACVRVIDGGVP